MKKDYVKPQIVIDNFMFNTNLAANCQKIHNSTQNVCGITNDNFPGMILFSGDVASSCDVEGDGSETDNDGFCYHVPEGAMQLFTS